MDAGLALLFFIANIEESQSHVFCTRAVGLVLRLFYVREITQEGEISIHYIIFQPRTADFPS